MPKSLRSSLRPPQIKVLRALMPTNPEEPRWEWPLVTRAEMRTRCGFSPTNSMNRILHGIKAGPSKHPGLIELGLISEEMYDIDGVMEANYRITTAGIQICQSLPKLEDASIDPNAE